MKQNFYQFRNLATGVLLIASVGVLPNNLPTQNLSQLTENVITASEDEELDVLETPETNPEVPDRNPDNPDSSEDEDDNDKENSDNSSEDKPQVPFDFQQDLIIKAVNPGYTVTVDSNKLSDAGELIELENLTGDVLALAGYSLQYTNGSGTRSIVFTFPEGSYMVGKHLLLRYRKAPEHELADINYANSLAMKAGPLELLYDGELVDAVCWTGKDDCYKEFKNDGKTSFRTTLVRNMYSGDFEHISVLEYEPEFNAKIINYVVEAEDEDNEQNNSTDDNQENNNALPKCQGLEFSEILSYYDVDKSEQFIELFNSTNQEVTLDGCQISYKNKTYNLTGSIKSGGYYAYYNSQYFALTKNPTNPIVLTLIDADGSIVDEVAYTNGQKKSTSYARVYDVDGKESWQVTYAITPNAENIYQKFRNCGDGKVINEATGNCVKVTSSATTKTLADCPAGQYRNPLTNRCKKIDTVTTSLKECAEGYERNPETNRCRKIKGTNDGEDYALVPATRSDKTVFVGLGIVLLIVTLGGAYVVLQFHHEIARTARKARERCNHICQNLISRTFGRDRNQKS